MASSASSSPRSCTLPTASGSTRYTASGDASCTRHIRSLYLKSRWTRGRRRRATTGTSRLPRGPVGRWSPPVRNRSTRAPGQGAGRREQAGLKSAPAARRGRDSVAHVIFQLLVHDFTIAYNGRDFQRSTIGEHQTAMASSGIGEHDKRPKVRLLHTADLHIGSDVYADDARRGLDAVLASARQHEVDAVLIAGDLFDKQARIGRYRGQGARRPGLAG